MMECGSLRKVPRNLRDEYLAKLKVALQQRVRHKAQAAKRQTQSEYPEQGNDLRRIEELSGRRSQQPRQRIADDAKYYVGHKCPVGGLFSILAASDQGAIDASGVQDIEILNCHQAIANQTELLREQ